MSIINHIRRYRLFALGLLLFLSLTMFGGCNRTEKKAVQRYQDALENAASLTSAKISLTANAQVSLNATPSMNMDLSLEGGIRDQGKKGAILAKANFLGQEIQAEIYSKNENIYIKTSEQEKYTRKPLGDQYAKLLGLGQADMQEIYKTAVESAKDLSVSEEADGSVSLSFTLPKQTLASMQETLKTLLEEQVQETMQQEVIRHLSFENCALKVTVNKEGYLSRQTMDFIVGLDMQALGKAMGVSEELPKDCKINLNLEYHLSEINQDIAIETPEFTKENTVE